MMAFGLTHYGDQDGHLDYQDEQYDDGGQDDQDDNDQDDQVDGRTWHIKLFERLLDSSLIRPQKLELVFRHLCIRR